VQEQHKCKNILDQLKSHRVVSELVLTLEVFFNAVCYINLCFTYLHI